MPTLESFALGYRIASPSLPLRASTRRLLLRLLVLLLTAAACHTAHAQKRVQSELHVAAAADMQTILPMLAESYKRETGIKVIASYGSSGTLSQQIINGAPFDIFFGADFSFPERVIAHGASDMKEPVLYGKGELVLFARKDSPLQPLNMEELVTPRVSKVAIADPLHAPFGFAAARAMDGLKLTEVLKPKLVTAENVSQAAQFVESGNAQVGFISLTLAKSPHLSEIGTYVIVPTVYPAIRQFAVTIKASKHLQEAHAFLEWVRSTKVQDEMQKLGLAPYLSPDNQF